MTTWGTKTWCSRSMLLKNGPLLNAQKLSMKRLLSLLHTQKRLKPERQQNLTSMDFPIFGKIGMTRNKGFTNRPLLNLASFVAHFYPTSHSPKSIRPSALLSLGKNHTGVINHPTKEGHHPPLKKTNEIWRFRTTSCEPSETYSSQKVSWLRAHCEIPAFTVKKFRKIHVGDQV